MGWQDFVVVDFETRSLIDLTVTGPYKYADHWSTRVNCMAYLVVTEPIFKRLVAKKSLPADAVKMWSLDDPFPEELRPHVESGALFHAHNAQFERLIWQYVCVERMQWPEIKFEQWRCTAAKARHANHAGALDDAVAALLPNMRGKDKEGAKIMKTTASPQITPIHKCGCDVKCTCDCICECADGCKCTTKSRKTGEVTSRKTCKCKKACKCKCGCRCNQIWVDDPISYAILESYCKQDVLVEAYLDAALPEWPESEIEVWQMNEHINDAGLPIDVELCREGSRMLDNTLVTLGEKISKLTDGEIHSGGQIGKIKDFVNARGVNTDDLQALTIEQLLLDPDLDPDAKDVLQLRQATAGAAAKKYATGLDVTDDDGRARGLFMYYGASQTGRFAGMKLQPQNMKHGTDTTGAFRAALVEQNQDLMEMLFGPDIITTLGKNVRSVICAPEGYKLIRVDSSQVECRISHWLAGNEKKLQMFRNGVDPYIELAKKVYNRTVGKGDKERQVCKHAELGLQYGQGAARFQAQVFQQSEGAISITEKFARQVVDIYRADNEPITQLWGNLEAAAKMCVEQRRTTRVGHISFGMWGDYMVMRLPSGRRLFYYQPKFVKEGRNWRFSYVTPRGRRFEWAGGLLINNAAQGTARDTLVMYAKEAHSRGIELVGQVHDELMALAPIEEADEIEKKLMECFYIRADWMGDLPLDAEAKVWRHYCD